MYERHIYHLALEVRTINWNYIIDEVTADLSSEALELEDAIYIAIVTLKENSEGRMTDENIGGGICSETVLRRLPQLKWRIARLLLHNNEVTETSGILGNLSTDTCVEYVLCCRFFA